MIEVSERPVPRATGAPPWLLGASCLVVLAAVLAVVSAWPEGAPLVAGLALGLGLAVIALQLGSTDTLLVATLLMSATALGSDDSVDIGEILFGVMLLGTLMLWASTQVLSGRDTVRSWADVAGLAYVFGVGSLGFGVAVLGGTAGSVDFRSDLTCLLAMAMYFPLREFVLRREHGALILGLTLMAVGMYASIDNAFRLRYIMSHADQLWKIVDVRIASGELQIASALLIAILMAAGLKRQTHRLLGLFAAALLLAGLVIAKSRGPWLAVVIGLGVALALVNSASRRRMLLVGASALPLVGAAAVIVLGPQLVLIGTGLLTRLASFSTAAQADPSLLNRYVETGAAWKAFLESPVVGHGWGAKLVHFNIISQATDSISYIHNGYFWIAHKTGLVGLFLFLLFLFGIFQQGLRTSRSLKVSEMDRNLAAGATVSILAALLLALPSNPFVVLDQMLTLSVVLSIASGTWHRARLSDLNADLCHRAPAAVGPDAGSQR